MVTVGYGQDPPERLLFITWKGDHGPRHVHVYRDGRRVVKWDLDHRKPMTGTASRRLRGIIEALEAEGDL